MKLLHISLMLIIALSFSLTANSQRHHHLEKIQAERVSFITSKLDLTSEEAEKFWPVYNEFDKKRNNLLLERRDIISRFNEKREELSSSEITEMVDSLVELRMKDAQLGMEYHEKLKDIISAERVMLLYLAEDEFRGRLLRRLRRDSDRRGSPD